MVCNPSFYRDKLTLHSIFEVEIQRLINHKRWPLHVHAVNDQQRTRTLRPFYTTRLRGQYLLSSIINRSSAEKQKRPTSLPSPVMVSFLREERQTDRQTSSDRHRYMHTREGMWLNIGRTWDRHTADTGSIPRCGKDFFFSKSQISVQTLLCYPYTPVCNRMH